MFEVACSWTGPPLAVEPRYPGGYKPNPTWRGPPVVAHDSYFAPHQELAARIARQAIDALKLPARPDLRTYAKAANRAE